ncbi:MAG: hypothetical protein IMZ52_03355 [Actinobacteria bacterium]|nr:hypothetical protein [Actinomycetota bacterium]MBE3123148.1 hypothetical protein [Thermoplasmata archaeon]
MEEDKSNDKQTSIKLLKGIDDFVRGIFLLLLIWFIVWLIEQIWIFSK